MTARRFRPRCRYFFTLITLAFLLPTSVEPQSGGSSVTLKATVSKTVALSISPHPIRGDVDVDVVGSGGTVRMTVSGKGAGPRVVHVPLFVRSNTDFRISGKFESTTALLSQLSVLNVRATGNLVSPQAVNNLEIPPERDLRGFSAGKPGASIAADGPFALLSGPRVSLGGTLLSPNNALQVTLVIRINSESVGGWLAHLTFFNE
jgi:hypothetical protein